MACTLKPEDIMRVKGLGFLNNKGTDCFNGRVLTTNGKVTAKQAMTVAEAAEKYGNGDVEFTSRQTIEVRGIHYNNIEAFRAYIAQAGLETGGTGPLVRPIVSCKGTTCQYGLIDTFDISEKIHHKFYKGYHSVKLPHKFKIAVGGCPNNCVKPTINDLGIIGAMVFEPDMDKCRGCSKCQVELSCPMKAASVKEGKLVIDDSICNNCGRCVAKCPFGVIDSGKPGYKVYIGGRWGKKMNQGRMLSKIFMSEEELMNVVEKAILFFREKGVQGERFAETIDRIGFENVEKELLSDDILTRKDEIIG